MGTHNGHECVQNFLVHYMQAVDLPIKPYRSCMILPFDPCNLEIGGQEVPMPSWSGDCTP